MIIKLYDGLIEQWHMFDNVRNLKFSTKHYARPAKSIDDDNEKAFRYDLIITNHYCPNHEDMVTEEVPNYKRITFDHCNELGKSEEINILFDDKVFVCNDKGKTIEVIESDEGKK